MGMQTSDKLMNMLVRGLRSVALVGVVILLAASGVQADEIRVMTSGAFAAALQALKPDFERASGSTLTIVSGAGAPDSIPNRLQRGEQTDVVIMAAAGIDELVTAGRVVPRSRVDLARSSIGIAVRAGAPKPDISTVDALTRALLQAKSVAYSSSVSGIYVSTELFQRLGIAAQLMPKSRRIETGPVAAVVARGEAELGIQQISELRPVAGIEVVGPLPPAVQRVTVFCAAAAAGSTNPIGGRALIAFLASPAASAAIAKSGMDPVASQAGALQPPPYDVVLHNGRVLDPESGLDGIRNVGITGTKIAAISNGALRGKTEIDATGLVVAPGFIDLHSHGQTPENYRYKAMDGVTTALELEVGVSPVRDWYAAREGRTLINFGASAGHVPARMAVMHDSGGLLPRDAAMNRPATLDEQKTTEAIVQKGLEEGGLGMGMGITYTPTASPDEILSLFSLAARFKRPVFVHMRAGNVVSSLQEVIADAAVSGASLHVVHINSAATAKTLEALRMIEGARARGLDVTTEAYPYTASMTDISSAAYSGWESRRPEDFARLLWPITGERLTRESFDRYRKQGGFVIQFGNTEEMVRAAIAGPLVMIASDGIIENGKGHPRGAGTFARVLGKYVREEHATTLMDAVRKSSLMPAERLESMSPQMRQKGRLKVGADADIAVFDPEHVIDKATFENAAQYSEGFRYVLVGGVFVVRGGQLQDGVAPGQPIRAVLLAGQSGR